MEITGKVLREVEFRDRLRGYDTDEVDEFLEEVALAVDELHARLAQQPNRAAPDTETKGRAPEQAISFDDDAIRRTLVLAQRTADLAIKEATEEANSVLEHARHEAEQLVSQASETARRMREDADEEFTIRVNAQLAQRQQLENDVRTLGSLVTEERGRLSDSLQTVLRFVSDNLVLSEEVTTRAASTPLVSTPAPVERGDRQTGMFFGVAEEDLAEESDLIDEIEDPFVFTEPVPIVPSGSAGAKSDPDEELWKRWAQNDAIDDDEGHSDPDPFGFDRRP